MKTLLTLLAALILIGGVFSESVQAQFYDLDGQLSLTWTAPNPATNPPLKDYIVTYYTFDYGTSVYDTSQVATTNVFDSTVNLVSQGSWCYAELQSRDYLDRVSSVVVSDTAYYDAGIGIDPPTGPTWTQ